jgi:hypothetical protein
MTVDNWIDAVNEGETTDGYDEWSKANAKPTNLYVIRKVSDRTKFWARKESDFHGWTSLERASVYVSTKGTSRRPSDEYEFVKLTKATA